MKTRVLGLLLTAMGACAYGAGCSSSSSGGTGGATGSGGSGTGGAGTGGSATGGHIADASTDSPTDAPSDGLAAPTFTQVFAIISNVTTPTADTAPGCANCHTGVVPDAGPAGLLLARSINYTDKAAAYAALVGTATPPVGVDSVRCPGADGGAALKRVNPGNAAQSVIVQKLMQGLGMGTACDGVGMPLNLTTQIDGGPDAGDAGSTMTHYAITTAQLATVVGWINAGALNN